MNSKRRLVVSIGVLALVGIAAFWWWRSGQSGNIMIVSKVPSLVRLPAGLDHDTVSLEIINGAPFVPVSINDRPARAFKLDTGAGNNFITVQMAEEIGLPLVTGIDHATMVGKHRSALRLYYAERIQIGGTVFEEVLFSAHLPDQVIKETPDLRLGFRMFSKTPFSIDFGRRELLLHRELDGASKSWIPMSIEAGVPITTFTLLHPETKQVVMEMRGRIDTGYTSSGTPAVGMPTGVTPTDSPLAEYLTNERAADSKSPVTASTVVYFETALDIGFGSVTRHGTFLSIFEMDGSFAVDHAYLGSSLFETAKATVVFDIPNQRWRWQVN